MLPERPSGVTEMIPDCAGRRIPNPSAAPLIERGGAGIGNLPSVAIGNHFCYNPRAALAASVNTKFKFLYINSQADRSHGWRDHFRSLAAAMAGLAFVLRARGGLPRKVLGLGSGPAHRRASPGCVRPRRAPGVGLNEGLARPTP